MISQFEKVGVTDYQFHIVEGDPRGGIYGCWESHRQVMKKIWKSKAPFGIVFEDDIEFTGN